MPASVTGAEAAQQEPAAGAALYVYGVVRADGAAAPDAPGVGDPPGRVSLVRRGDIAALVSEIDVTRPLGTPEDLVAHQRLLDEASAAGPVLPMRFGGVVRDAEAIEAELLEPHHDEFADALDEVTGRAQYVLSGRYDGSVILGEVLAEQPEAARLQQEIRGQDEVATRPARMQLGEIVGDAVAAKREADTEAAVGVLEPFCAAIAAREPAHEFDAVHLALLADSERQAALEQAFDRLAADWAGRIELRLLGPMAPYDFVISPDLEE